MLQSSEGEGELHNVLETDMRPGDIRLWSQGEVKESAEEEGTPMPVAFGPVLAFMETAYEDARKEYLGLKEPRIQFAEDATQLYALEDGAG
eukprot:gene36342-biopygen2887